MKEKNILNKTKKWIVILLVLLVTLVGFSIFVMKVKDNNQKEDITNKDNISGEVNEINLENEVNMDNSTSINKNLNKTEIKMDLMKRVENLEISNITLNKKNNTKVEFIADVKNTTTEFSESKVIEITAVGENGEIIAIFSGLVSKLAAKEEERFITQVLKDITMAKDFEFSIVK